MTAFLEVKNLKKTYYMGEIAVHALRGVNLKVDRGEFVLIFGPSGCGKTTMLNLLAGIDKITEGEILYSINGKSFDLVQMTERNVTEFRRTSVGFIFQFYNLIPALSAFENVEFAARFNKSTDKSAYETAIEMLHAVGMKGMEHKRPGQLSGGDQQRIAIARALAKNPTIILADEPTGNIQSAQSLEIYELMKSFAETQDITFLIVTHNPELSQTAQRLIHLQDGLIIRDETQDR